MAPRGPGCIKAVRRAAPSAVFGIELVSTGSERNRGEET